MNDMTLPKLLTRGSGRGMFHFLRLHVSSVNMWRRRSIFSVLACSLQFLLEGSACQHRFRSIVSPEPPIVVWSLIHTSLSLSEETSAYLPTVSTIESAKKDTLTRPHLSCCQHPSELSHVSLPRIAPIIDSAVSPTLPTRSPAWRWRRREKRRTRGVWNTPP